MLCFDNYTFGNPERCIIGVAQCTIYVLESTPWHTFNSMIVKYENVDNSGAKSLLFTTTENIAPNNDKDTTMEDITQQ